MPRTPNPESVRLYLQPESTLEKVARQLNGTILGVRKDLIQLGVDRHPRGQKPLPKPCKAEMEELVNVQRMSDPQIGDLYHVNKSTVRRWRQSYRIDPVPVMIARPPREELEDFVRGKGLSDGQIAKLFGVHRSTALTWRRREQMGPSSPPTQSLKKK